MPGGDDGGALVLPAVWAMNGHGMLWFRSEHSQNNVWPGAAGVNAPAAVPDDADKLWRTAGFCPTLVIWFGFVRRSSDSTATDLARARAARVGELPCCTAQRVACQW